MTIKINRRHFMAGSAALAAGTAAGLSSPFSAELAPQPTAADLVGGPNWTPPDLSGQTIRLWGLNYAPHVERYQMLIDQFTKATNAEVKLEPQDEIAKNVMTALAGSNPPDVICLMGRMSDGLVKLGGLLDVTDAVYGDLGVDMDAWWFGDAMEAYTWDGRAYGVPLESNALSGCGVRTDLVAKAGLLNDASIWPGAVPEAEWGTHGTHFNSYEQMFELAAAIQQKTGETVNIWGQNRQTWEFQGLASMLWQQGVRWFDKESNEFALDNDECTLALEYMVTRPYGLGIESKLAVETSVAAFAAGQAAIAIGNSSAAGEGAKVGFEATTLLVPSMVAGEKPKIMGEGGWGFEVPARARNQKAAIEFLKFATTYEAQHTWSQIYGGLTPACAALVKSDIYVGDNDIKRGQRRLLSAIDSTSYLGNGFDPQIPDMFSQIISTLREGKLTARETATELQRQVAAQQSRFVNG